MRPFGVDDPGEHARAISRTHVHQRANMAAIALGSESSASPSACCGRVTLGGDPIGAADGRPCRARRNVNPRERMVRSGCFGDVMVWGERVRRAALR